MPSDLRKRKAESSGLPSTVSNPKPAANEVGHAASNRQKPTIAPTVFMLLIVGLMFALFPIFYYTQVMLPDPLSTSILSNFRNKGNTILNALGHTSSAGNGRIPFNSEHKNQIPPASKGMAPPIIEQENKDSLPPSGSLGRQTTQPPDTMAKTSDPITTSTTTTTTTTTPSEKLSPEKQKKLDEELGLFWEASSRYRREAQKQKAGQYALQGDGTALPPQKATPATATAKEEEEGGGAHGEQPLSLDRLPDADPDAKEGLTPEFWDAIKHQFSADDLTLVLNDMRRTEQAAAQSLKL
ncbi:hypothetical protein PGT21_027180 [Puccinia graminis f. sp. tritici]|uniref:Uncharacterized protein n=1 Tax=Puccinia graminis f. sp. tritici TaxID=56615 RepID=A0A5B0MVD4_PUCGR|nr:hypothetical protein PGT21_027180 [Puccinia graminis f. sp. tritici]KAA1131145.1 hypothetical protein PGTUg99_017249 [Puccinia graminis f. sp. tritici]